MHKRIAGQIKAYLISFSYFCSQCTNKFCSPSKDNEKEMRIIDLIQSNEKTAFSFEILPPLKGTGIEKLYETIDTLREFDPKYINITTHRSEYVYKDLGNGLFQRNRLRRPSVTALTTLPITCVRFRYSSHVLVLFSSIILVSLP